MIYLIIERLLFIVNFHVLCTYSWLNWEKESKFGHLTPHRLHFYEGFANGKGRCQIIHKVSQLLNSVAPKPAIWSDHSKWCLNLWDWKLKTIIWGPYTPYIWIGVLLQKQKYLKHSSSNSQLNSRYAQTFFLIIGLNKLIFTSPFLNVNSFQYIITVNDIYFIFMFLLQQVSSCKCVQN